MFPKQLGVVFALGLFISPLLAQAVEVVPIGQTIKPEQGSGPEPSGNAPHKAKKKAAPAATTLKAGHSFMVESAEIVSSGLTKQGETVYFRAAEEVGSGNRPVIFSGALASGQVTTSEKGKNGGKIVVKIDSIESVSGEKIPISGQVNVDGDKSQAAYAVGERFTATLDEKASVKGKFKKEEIPTFEKNAFAEIRGQGVKADIKKGQVKGKVELILETSKEVSIDDVVPESVALYRVNDHLTPKTVPAATGSKAKVGDSNKNGTADMLLTFDAWDFIKFQPRGSNMIYVKGKLKNGQDFDANTKVTIDY